MYLKNSHVWHMQASTGLIMFGTLCFIVERERESGGDGIMKNQLIICKKGGRFEKLRKTYSIVRKEGPYLH